MPHSIWQHRRIFLVLAAFLATGEAHAMMPLCHGAHRYTCVVDGDTFWLKGEKIRLEGVDAPEVEGKCKSERRRASKATDRLRQLLDPAAIDIARAGVDRYGRTLAAVSVHGQDIGAALVGEGLARSWSGRRVSWCGFNGP